MRYLPSLWALANALFFTWLMWDDARGVCWPCPVVFVVIGLGLMPDEAGEQVSR